MGTPKKPVKKPAAKEMTDKPAAKPTELKPKRQFDDDDDDDDFAMPLDDLDYDSLENYEDED